MKDLGLVEGAKDDLLNFWVFGFFENLKQKLFAERMDLYHGLAHELSVDRTVFEALYKDFDDRLNGLSQKVTDSLASWNSDLPIVVSEEFWKFINQLGRRNEVNFGKG
jgi:hypothetical protein